MVPASIETVTVIRGVATRRIRITQRFSDHRRFLTGGRDRGLVVTPERGETKKRRHGLAINLAMRLARAWRALSVAMPVFAYIWR